MRKAEGEPLAFDMPKDLESTPTEAEFVEQWSGQFKGTTKEYWRTVYREQYGGDSGV